MTEITDDMIKRAIEARSPFIPGIFPESPEGFTSIPPERVNGCKGWYVRAIQGQGALRVGCSAIEEADGKLWMHVSMSRNLGLPSYKDMSLVKDTFIGEHRKAVQVFPPKSEYVTLHSVLHLWALVEGDMGLPDFRKDDGRQI